jgi:hypothetical protein
MSISRKSPSSRPAFWSRQVLPALLVVLLGLSLSQAAWAATCNWNSVGANWGTAANWTCDGGGTNHVPIAGDSVTFGPSDGACTVNVDPNSLASFTIGSDYAGTITMSGATRSIILTAGYSQAGGTFSATSFGSLVVGTTFAISGGTFNAPLATLITGAFSQTGGAFTGSTTNNVKVVGNFSVSAGTFTAPSTLSLGGTFGLSGTGVFTHNSGTVLLTAGAARSHTFGSAAFNQLIITDDPAVTSGLVGHWKFDDSSDPADEASGNNYTLAFGGTPVGYAHSFAPIAGNQRSYDFDLGDYLEDTSIPVALQPAVWTVTTWFKPDDLDDGNSLCGAQTDGSEILSIGDDLVIRACGYGTAGSPTTASVSIHMNRTLVGGAQICDSSNTVPLNDGKWHFAAITNNGTNLAVYLDGVWTVCAASSGVQEYAGTTMRVAKHHSGSSYDYDGMLDDLRMYNRALTNVEILALHGGGSGAGGGITHTGSGAFSVAGNLLLGGSTLAGTSTISVAGSWLNHGGGYTGSGTVTLNGTATGKAITSNGQWFAALTLNGTGGAWTLSDRLWVDGDLTIAAGTLATANYTIHAATLNKANGGAAVFTPGTGTLVLDSSTGHILTSDTALNNLRIEDPTETGLVGYWKLDETFGTTLRDSSGNGKHGTFNTGGTRVNSGTNVAPTGYDNYGALTFETTVTNDPTVPCDFDAKMSVAFWVKAITTATTQNQRMFFSPWLQVVLRQDNKLRSDVRWSGSTPSWEGNAAFTRNAWQHVVVTYDGSGGTAYANKPDIYVNGTKSTTMTIVAGSQPVMGDTRTETPTSGTCYLGNADPAYFGGGFRDFEGTLDDVRIYNNVILTQTEVTAMYNSGTGAYANRGGTATYTLQANTTVSGSTTVDSGATQTVYRAYQDQGGTIEGFPMVAFDWADYEYHATYVAYNNVIGSDRTSGRIYKRDTNGVAAGYFALTNGLNFVGSPKWTHDGVVDSAVYYIYAIDNAGTVYKLNDASFTSSGGSAVAVYSNGAGATATSPLAADTTNLYWTGLAGDGTTSSVFRLPQAAMTGAASVGTTTVSNGAVASLATVGAEDFVFFANASKLYKVRVAPSMGTLGSSTWSTGTAVYGRVSVPFGTAYFVDGVGKVYAALASDLTAVSGWPYQDTAGHGGSCLTTTCGAKGLFVNYGMGAANGNVIWGDYDGHVYSVNTSTATALTGYPWRPNDANDIFETAPLYRAGIIAIGSKAGKVYFIDHRTVAGGTPANHSNYNFCTTATCTGSAVSSISYDFDGGQYVIGTADGKLYYVAAITDPTNSHN